ncbi:kinase-like domain-containing protein [Pyrenochaeta sp. MPI-SDFR-AT-0127]|nr:kinase-like domain-containing protein [Pyrenochaeta sp. MPI-SDFR-AT-0127]
MSHAAVPRHVLDDHAAKLVGQIQEEHRSTMRCEEANFDRLASILTEMGKNNWALRPRTYAVLRMIDRLDVMDNFIEQDLRDIHFPYTERRLPVCLSEIADRLRFIEAQDHVLTAARDVEDIESKVHRNLKNSGDEMFYFVVNLGRGGFGYVDRVRSRLSLNEFALKRSMRGKMFSKDKSALRVFVDELNILKRLSHPHLVQYVGSYTDPKWVGILMTPVAECDLRIFLDREQATQHQNFLRQAYGCLITAVHYLHQNRIRHKDLKPQNILIKDSNVLITDFGTALDWNDESRATTTGEPGPISINYAAPEVADHERRSESSDIWSLGCVFVEMTTVLKGLNNEDRKSFFTSHFTGSSSYCRNPEALEAWLQQLELIPRDNVTIGWIRSMLQHDRTKRIADSHLMDDILKHQEDHVYYGPCCAEQDEADTSSDGTSSVQGASEDVALYSAFTHNAPPRPEPDSLDATIATMATATKASQLMQTTESAGAVKGEKGDGHFNPNPPSSNASYLSAYNMSLRERGGYDAGPTYEANYDAYGVPIAPPRAANALNHPVGAQQAEEQQLPSSGPGFVAPNEILNPVSQVPQLPSWDEVMGYTGISMCKGAW